MRSLLLVCVIFVPSIVSACDEATVNALAQAYQIQLNQYLLKQQQIGDLADYWESNISAQHGKINGWTSGATGPVSVPVANFSGPLQVLSAAYLDLNSVDNHMYDSNDDLQAGIGYFDAYEVTKTVFPYAYCAQEAELLAAIASLGAAIAHADDALALLSPGPYDPAGLSSWIDSIGWAYIQSQGGGPGPGGGN